VSGLPFRTLSFSSVNDFAGYGGCELAWYYDRIERIPRRPKGPGMLVGTAWDNACSRSAQAKMDGKEPAPDLAAETFLDTIRNPPPDEHYDLNSTDEKREEISRASDRGPLLAREWVQGPLSTIKPKAVQRRIEIAFDEVPWVLTGYVDLVEAAERGGELLGVVPVDHKATLSSSRKFGDAEAESSLQLGLYDFALQQEGEHVLGRGYRWARILKTKHELGLGLAPSTDETRASALDLLARISQRIEQACETGNFLPTARLTGSWKCARKFCDYFDRCPHGAKARTVVALQAKEAPKEEAA
jgi:hypothetical protein